MPRQRITDDDYRHRYPEWMRMPGPELLRRSLAFLHRDVRVRDLSPEVRKEWWLFLTFLSPTTGGSWATAHHPEVPTVAQLEKAQTRLRDGVAKILKGQQWQLPVPEALSLEWTPGSPPSWTALAPRYQPPGRDAPPVPPARYRWRWYIGEDSMIQVAVASLIYHHGDRLRACATCELPFLAVKRQLYCGPACTALGQRPRTKKEE